MYSRYSQPKLKNARFFLQKQCGKWENRHYVAVIISRFVYNYFLISSLCPTLLISPIGSIRLYVFFQILSIAIFGIYKNLNFLSIFSQIPNVMWGKNTDRSLIWYFWSIHVVYQLLRYPKVATGSSKTHLVKIHS